MASASAYSRLTEALSLPDLKKSFETHVDKNAMTIQKEFFPWEYFMNEKEMQAYFEIAPNGIIAEYNGTPATVESLDAGFYFSQGMLEWRERTKFDEKTFTKVYDPMKPNEIISWKKLVNKALMNSGVRVNNRNNWLAHSVILNNRLALDSGTVTYTVPDDLRLDLNDTATTNYTDVRDIAISGYSWTPGGTTGLWSDLTSATPIDDLINAAKWFRRATGNRAISCYMSTSTADLMQRTSQYINEYKSSDMLSKAIGNVAALSTIYPEIPSINMVDDSWTVATTVTAAAASGATSLVVADYANLSNGDMLKITDKATRKTARVAITADPSSTTLTVGALPFAITAGSIVEAHKYFLPDGYIIFKLDAPRGLQAMASTPSALTNMENPQPGPYTVVAQSVYQDDPWVRVTAGMNAAPIVWGDGGFGVLRVLDTTNPY